MTASTVTEGTLNGWRLRISNIAELLTLQDSTGMIVIPHPKQQEAFGLMLNDIVSEMDEVLNK